MTKNRYDIAIVGGGIIGLAVAYTLQLYSSKLRLVIFEKEDSLAFHQTGRNSGVLHSGLYYKPGSLRAKNCVDGRKKIIKFAQENHIDFDICGKLVVATNKKDAARLDELKINGIKNGLSGLKIMSPDEFKKIEPYVEGVKALYVPQTGIIDYKGVANCFANIVKKINNHSQVITSCKVISYTKDCVKTTKGVFNSRHIIFCGGLFADRLALKDNIDLDMQIVGFRGDYYKLSSHSKYKVNHLIYPVPNPDFPFLGVHFTRMVNGDIECGPNAVFTFKREGYKTTSFSFKDAFQALMFKGTIKLFINNWKFGLNEYKRAFSKYLFLKELRKMMPSLSMNDIVKGKSGVRAMALNEKGQIIDDFKILRSKRNIHVLNAPSPAATACLSVAEKVLEEARIYFKI